MDKALAIFIKLAAVSRLGTWTDLMTQAHKILSGPALARKVKQINNTFGGEFTHLTKTFTGKSSPGVVYRKGKRAVHTAPKVTL